MGFVGRERELGRLGAALERAAGGQLARVVVTGSTGLGTSRLLTELERRLLGEPGFIVARGTAWEPFSGHPYGALSEALRGPLSALPDDELCEVAGSAGHELAMLLPDLGPRLARSGAISPEPLLSAPDQRGSRLVEAVLGVVGRLARGGAVLLALDDLHWADAGTRSFVEAVLRVSLQVPLCLVVAYHPDELERRHPLGPLAEMLANRDLVETVELQPLGRDETLALIESETGERPTAGLVAAVVERSKGNPLIAEQLLAARRSVPALRLSDSFDEILQARLAILSGSAVRSLRVLAALRRPLVIDALLRLDSGEGRLSGAGLEEALESGLAVEHRDGVMIAQTIYAEALESALDPARRQTVHAVLAAAVDGPPAEIAWHWERAMLLAQARDAHVAAGEAAELLDPGGTALEHYLRAIELDGHDGCPRAASLGVRPWMSRAAVEAWTSGARAPLDRQDAAAARETEPLVADRAGVTTRGARRATHDLGVDRAGLLARAAQAAFVVGAFRRASALASLAIDARVGAGSALLRPSAARGASHARGMELALLYERLGRYRWAAGDVEAALSAFRTAVQMAPLDPSPDRARVLAALAQALMLEGRFTESAKVARRSIEVARAVGEGSLAELGHATCTLGMDVAYGGDLEPGLELLREAASLSRKAGRLDDLMRAYANQTTVLDLDSRREEALAVVEEGIVEARRWGQEAVYGAFLRGNAADCLFVLGRWQESETMCRQALEWSPTGVAWFIPLVALALVRVESAADEEAGRVLGQLLLQLETVPDVQWTAAVQRATVSFALWREDLADARRAVTWGWERIRRTDDWSHIALAASTALEVAAALAEASRGRRDTQGVAEAAGLADNVLAEAERRLAASTMPPTLGARREADLHLATARAHRERLRGQPNADAWHAIGEAWAAIPVPYLEARAYWWEAEAVLRTRLDQPRARADRVRARRAIQDAWQIATDLGAAPLQRELIRLAARARISLPVMARHAAASAAAAAAEAAATAAYLLPGDELGAAGEAGTAGGIDEAVGAPGSLFGEAGEVAQSEREVRLPTPLFPDARRRTAGSAGFGPGGREAEEDREGAFPAAAMAGAGRQATGRLIGRGAPHAAYSPGLAQRLAPEPAVAPSDPFNLSPREREVLGVLAEGCTNREIAHRLFISERTVAVHVGNILAKLGASGRVEAAMVALRLGLVPSTPPATAMSALARPAPLAAATRSMHPSVIPGASQPAGSRWGTLPAPARARTDQARPAGKPRL